MLTMSWQYYMRQIICEKYAECHLQESTAPESKQPEPVGVSDGVSITAPAHAAGSSVHCACANSSSVSSVSRRSGGQTTIKQPSNETTKTSKPKKTSEEKQAKKKALDATLWGGILEASWSAAQQRGKWRDLEVVLVQEKVSFSFSLLAFSSS